MGSEISYKTYKLGEIGEIITGKTPLTKIKENFGDFIPFVTPGDLQNGKYVRKTDRYLSKMGLEEVKNKYLPAGSIMVSCIGTVGEIAIAGEDCVTNQQINSIIPYEDFSPDYIYYNLKQRKNELQTFASGGSVVPIINKTDFSELEIVLPDREEQNRVGNILSSLDNKIELNQHINETLEAIARAIFKSWFVDFDPVRAKIKGEPYPLPDAVMALFPDELVESELGMIPKGWEVKSLSEVCEITKGVSYRSKELEGKQFALVNLKSINRGGGYRLDGLKPFCGDFKCEQEVHHGDIILAYTDVTQAAELLGRPARVQKIDNRRLIASLDIGIVRSEILPKEFIYFTLNSYRFNEYAKNHANGTTVLHLSRKAIPKFLIVVPTKNLLNEFLQISNTLFKIIDSNTYQNNVLPNLREELIRLHFQN